MKDTTTLGLLIAGTTTTAAIGYVLDVEKIMTSRAFYWFLGFLSMLPLYIYCLFKED